MKYLIVFLLAMLLASVSSEGQKLTSVKPYGSKGLYEVTPTNDTISLIPKYSASAYAMSIDTSVVLQVDTIQSNPCNLVYFQLTADATKRYVTFDTGLEAAYDSITATKTRTWGFVFIKGKYVLMHRSQEY